MSKSMLFSNSSGYTQCRKYRYMDGSLTQRRKGLEDKIPDIKKTLHMVEFLQTRRVGSLGMHI